MYWYVLAPGIVSAPGSSMGQQCTSPAYRLKEQPMEQCNLATVLGRNSQLRPDILSDHFMTCLGLVLDVGVTCSSAYHVFVIDPANQ